MDLPRPGCEPAPVSARKPSPLDEADGSSAAGALLVGDLDGAVDALERVSPYYLVAFLWRPLSRSAQSALKGLVGERSDRVVCIFDEQRLRCDVAHHMLGGACPFAHGRATGVPVLYRLPPKAATRSVRFTVPPM